MATSPPSEIEVSRPDKLLWASSGITKRHFVDYLGAVSDHMLPWVRQRPMTLVRAPDGVGGKQYFQKAVPTYAPEWIRTVRIPAPSAGRDVDFVVCENRATLQWLGNQAALDRWRAIADAVNAAGAHMLVQLWHAGIQRDAPASRHPDVASMGPSGVFPVTDPERPGVVETKTIGLTMTQGDIDRTIDHFAAAAKTCQDLGFSGIELHAAHGYLFDQFFWSETNLRTDRYGGDITQRTRFATETIAEIRRRVGHDFLIGLRFSQFKPPLYTAKLAQTPDELERFLTPLASAGLDIIHASARRFWQPEFEGSNLTIAGWAKKITGLPTISVGSVALDTGFDPRNGAGAAAGTAGLEPLIQMLERGDFDIIAIGRSLLANPEWPRIVREQGAEALAAFDKAVLDELV